MKDYRVYWGEWKNGGFSWDLFVEEVDTLEEAIQVGLRTYDEKDKHNAAMAYKVNEAGEDVDLVFERRGDIDIEQSYIDGFHDALKSLAPSFDAEEDMHISGTPWAEYSFIGTPYSDLATEAIAYEAGKKAAEAVADEIEKLSAMEAEMERERVEEEYEEFARAEKEFENGYVDLMG